MVLSDEEKRKMIAQIIWESKKWGTERKEELLEYFTRISVNSNSKKEVWYIEASTGCLCCASENFDQGFYLNKEEPQAIIDEWKIGNGNPLASQYAKYGRYYLHKTEAEILPDGRMIINGSIFNADDLGCRICW